MVLPDELATSPSLKRLRAAESGMIPTLPRPAPPKRSVRYEILRSTRYKFLRSARPHYLMPIGRNAADGTGKTENFGTDPSAAHLWRHNN